MTSSRGKLAVIGAGISGLICARQLRDAGWDVSVFEKSRGVGGRMSTRRTADGLQFDHGAQYFTVRDECFGRYVKTWIHDGVAAPWEGRIVTLTAGRIEPKESTTRRFVGVPGMNAICKYLAADLNIRFQTRVASLNRDHNVWRIDGDNGNALGDFDCVITCAPAPQAAELLAAAPNLQQMAQATTMDGCWAAMLSFEGSLELSFDGAFVHDSPLSWIARNDTKPERGNGQECWVLHASPVWTERHIEENAEDVLPRLIAAFWEATGATHQPTSYSTAHLWRFAIPLDPLEEHFLIDPQLSIGACGDWCNGPRVEGAFLSGMALADVLRAHAGFAR